MKELGKSTCAIVWESVETSMWNSIYRNFDCNCNLILPSDAFASVNFAWYSIRFCPDF